jgi:hypothetical protein
VFGVVKQVFHIGYFADIARIHDTGTITGFRNNTQIMGNQ